MLLRDVEIKLKNKFDIFLLDRRFMKVETKRGAAGSLLAYVESDPYLSIREQLRDSNNNLWFRMNYYYMETLV